MNTSHERTNPLIERARMLGEARTFFAQRQILEVDPPALLEKPQIDANIDVMTVNLSETQIGYLHTSPEYSMKKLLSQGCKDIYYLGHVFRKEEMGKRHSPEFTMVEWYRLSYSLEQMIQETCEFLFLFLGKLPIQVLPYREAFHSIAQLDYTVDDLTPFLPPDSHHWSRQEALHWILADRIEPKLGIHQLTVLTEYPPNEAALAKTHLSNGDEVALRFEIYYQGIELANGYHELTDANILKQRFEKENQARKTRNLSPLPIDETFLATINQLPDCCGVSVGFDRALMLQQKAQTIHTYLGNPNVTI